MKAVIATAGYGTRFFPVSKAVSKCMLPVLDRPVVDYIVDDLIDAGIEEIQFVVQPGNSQVRDYYSLNEAMESTFRKNNWMQKYDKVKGLHSKAAFSFVEQREGERYGTATPVLLSTDFVEGEDFVYVAGDDVVLPGEVDGYNHIRDLVSAHRTASAVAAISCVEVDPTDASKYGVVVAHGGLLSYIEEKPATIPNAPTYASISRYILPSWAPELFNELPVDERGELSAVDGLLRIKDSGPVAVSVVCAPYFDCGSVPGWLAANVYAAQNDAVETR